MITLVEPPIRQAIIPKVVAGDFKQAAKLVSRAFSAGFWLTTILALLAAILSPWIIPLAYGQAFVAAVPAFLLLLPSMVLLANLTIEVFFYYQLGRPEVPTSVVVATALLGIPILYLFTVHWGYLGTALGTSVLAGVRAAAIIIAYLHLSRESLGQLFAIKRSELTILSHMMKGSGR